MKINVVLLQGLNLFFSIAHIATQIFGEAACEWLYTSLLVAEGRAILVGYSRDSHVLLWTWYLYNFESL